MQRRCSFGGRHSGPCKVLPLLQSRDWILRKKDQARQRGRVGVRPDSKYTGRKRKDRF